MFFGISFILSCTNDDIDDPRYVLAHVDSTKHVHWGRGFYKLKVYCSFRLSDSLYTSEFFIDKLEKSFTSTILEGDSVLIKYDNSNPRKTEFVKIAHKK